MRLSGELTRPGVYGADCDHGPFSGSFVERKALYGHYVPNNLVAGVSTIASVRTGCALRFSMLPVLVL